MTENVFNRELKKRAEKNAWIAILTELVYARRRTSLVSLGRVVFEYKGNSETIVTAMAKKYSLTQEMCKRLLDYLAMTFAYFGALKIDDDILDADDRKYIFYTDKQKFVTLQKTASTDRYSLSWKARNREGKADSFYPNSRVRLVAKILQSDERRANEFLEDYFNNWLISPRNRDYKLEKGNGDIYCMPAEYYIVRVCGDQNAHWYRCAKCGKISTTNIDGHCVENGCDGTLEEIDPVQFFADNHYLSLYNKQEYTSLLIREHTAQLSREEGLKYQTDFEKNRIHALSCSTTFEMGVDVGELETVFLRNVPPSAANYTQRAGRAGRSKNASAYSLTYAKLSSHDFNFFNEPQKIITGQIKPPVFKTDNEKIVLRHIYAVVLSYFFKQYPNYFGNNRTTEFLDNGGYDVFIDLVKNSPSELNNLLQKSIPSIQSYDWQEKMIGENGLLHNTVCEYEQTVEQLEGMIKEYADQKDYDKASRLQRSLTRYKAKEMIDFLVRNNVLPKYGFPIDTVELEVTADERQKQELQLSRDLKMAIAEYVPGEKVIANNKMYTSRYIKKSFFNNHMDYYYSFVCECPECKTWNYSVQNPKDLPERRKCVACGHTRKIAETSFKPLQTEPKLFDSAIAGTLPKIIFAESEISIALNRAIHDILNNGITNIQIISCAPAGHSSVQEYLTANGNYLCRKTEIAFTTCRKFKGLEADAVVLIDVDYDTICDQNKLFYVGASRARLDLFIICNLSDDECTQVIEAYGSFVKKNNPKRTFAKMFGCSLLE